MASNKRIFYSHANCHNLVDAIYQYKNIVECKKTDAVTWKRKNVTWNKIRDIYNAATTEPRSSEQLRCKYDNLKKIVRKYEAQGKKDIYGTDVDAETKLLYNKVKNIISLSVKNPGDSEVLPDNFDQEICIKAEVEEEDTVVTSHSQDEIHARFDSEIIVPEINNDWTIHKSKRRQDSEDSFEEEVLHLKRRLLEREADRNEEYHQLRMEKEEELYNLKIRNHVLQNKKLEMEISLLRQRFEGS